MTHRTLQTLTAIVRIPFRSTGSRNLRPVCLLVCLVCLSGSRLAEAQQRAATDDQIRDRTEQILSRGEFRYFQRLGSGEDGDSGAGDAGEFRDEPGDGQAGNGEAGDGRFGEGGANGRGPGRNRQPRDLREADFPRGGQRHDGGNGGGADPDWGGDGGADRSSTSLGLGGSGSSLLGAVYAGVAWAFIGIIVAFLLFIVIRSLANWQPDRPPTDGDALSGEVPVDLELERPPGATPADVFLERARELAKAGKFREAVAQLLLGAMSTIERAGIVRFRHGLTLRDYLRALRQQPQAYEGLKSMIRIYEPLGFGRRQATRKHFELTMAGYQQGFSDGTLAVSSS